MARKPVHTGRVTRLVTAESDPTVTKRAGRFAALGIDIVVVIVLLIAWFMTISDTAPRWTMWVPTAFIFCYPILTIGLLGRTIGQLVVGVRVVRADDFERPGFIRAAVRTVGVFVPAVFVPAGLGYVAAIGAKGSFAFSETRQGVHDRLAGTIVVNELEWQDWTRENG